MGKTFGSGTQVTVRRGLYIMDYNLQFLEQADC
jgi:hypothetical protein